MLPRVGWLWRPSQALAMRPLWCRRGDLHPYAPVDPAPSTLDVCYFRHDGKMVELSGIEPETGTKAHRLLRPACHPCSTARWWRASALHRAGHDRPHRLSEPAARSALALQDGGAAANRTQLDICLRVYSPPRDHPSVRPVVPRPGVEPGSAFRPALLRGVRHHCASGGDCTTGCQRKPKAPGDFSRGAFVEQRRRWLHGPLGPARKQGLEARIE